VNKMYFDYNASHPILPELVESLDKGDLSLWGNPSSAHSAGREARDKIEEAREIVAQSCGRSHQELVFCSGATEANHDLIRSYTRLFSKERVFVSKLEHPCVLSACELSGNETVFVPYAGDRFSGQPDFAAIQDQVQKDDLIVCMAANNETGQIFDLDFVSDLAARKGAWFHCDAVQVFAKSPGLIPKSDSLSISAHKIGGLSGVGALISKPLEGLSLIPGSQERGKRGGTENLLGIQSFLIAVQSWQAKYQSVFSENMPGLNKYLEESLLEIFPQAQLQASSLKRLSSTSNVSFPGLEGESLLFSLDIAGIQCSLGSACSSGSIEASPVLLEMGLSEKEAKSSLRISMGVFTSRSEIDQLISTLEGICKRMLKAKRK